MHGRARPNRTLRPLDHDADSLILSATDLKQTDRCVMCGLCLPHCPTYLETQDEGDSPRGRIALMQSLDRNELGSSSSRLAFHLDRCLECRACEAMCPSRVPFGALMDAARARIEPTRPRTRAQRLVRRLALDTLVPHKRALRLAGRLLRLYQRSGLRYTARATGLLGAVGLSRADTALPELARPGRWLRYYPPSAPQRGTVALFTGCVAELADTQTLQASISVLNRLGFGVHVPRGQACCGAIHQHNGEPQRAAELAQRNIDAFEAVQPDVILTAASGCGAMLAEYGTLNHPPREGDAKATAFGARVQDINSFLDACDWAGTVRLAPLRARVAVHLPCSLRNVLKRPDAPASLLSRIPQIELIPLTEHDRCCGAAGSYVLTQPDMADRLREPHIAAIRSQRPALVVTANVGCAMHLSAGLRAAGVTMEIIHPVVLLERQLR